MTYPPKTENLTLSKPGCGHGIRTSDHFRGEKRSEGEQEAKKIKMATTLGAEKKRSERQEKMTNTPYALQQPSLVNTRQKRRESN